MRYLILSDIHANQEALDAVLADAAGHYDSVLCCGDLVGYGADPDSVVAWCSEHATHVVRGNHDKACVGLEDLDWFNPLARASAEWTHQHMSAESIEYLRSLPRGPLGTTDCDLVHGSPVDEDEYVLSMLDALQVNEYLSTAVTFFGHTHLQGGFYWRRRSTQAIPRPGPNTPHLTLDLEPDTLYLINPGSVGQPRDRDPRAAYAIFEPAVSLQLRRVAYDIESAQRKILAAGLPEFHALRLERGQ